MPPHAGCYRAFDTEHSRTKITNTTTHTTNPMAYLNMAADVQCIRFEPPMDNHVFE